MQHTSCLGKPMLVLPPWYMHCGASACSERLWAAQGVDGWDVDLPTYLEANWITSFVAKAAWVLVYIVVYGLRPVLIRPKPIGESSPVWGLVWASPRAGAYNSAHDLLLCA